MSEYIKLIRPPENSGVFISPAKYLDIKKEKLNPAWNQYVEFKTEDILNLISNYESGQLDLVFLWSKFGCISISKSFEQWILEVKERI